MYKNDFYAWLLGQLFWKMFSALTYMLKYKSDPLDFLNTRFYLTFLTKEVLIGTPWGGGNKNLLAPPGGVNKNLLAPPQIIF